MNGEYVIQGLESCLYRSAGRFDCLEHHSMALWLSHLGLVLTKGHGHGHEYNQVWLKNRCPSSRILDSGA